MQLFKVWLGACTWQSKGPALVCTVKSAEWANALSFCQHTRTHTCVWCVTVLHGTAETLHGNYKTKDGCCYLASLIGNQAQRSRDGDCQAYNSSQGQLRSSARAHSEGGVANRWQWQTLTGLQGPICYSVLVMWRVVGNPFIYSLWEILNKYEELSR